MATHLEMPFSVDPPLFGWLMEAWAAAPTFRSLQLPTPRSRMPCLALRCDENGRCSARVFKGTEAGGEAAIRPGSHSFVKVPHEDFLRASKIAFASGQASGHCVLADETPTLFAGEIEIDENGSLISWNNMSGTYRFPAEHAGQAELPLEMFWELVSEEPAIEDSANWRRLSDGKWLHKSGKLTQPKRDTSDGLQRFESAPLGANAETDSEYFGLRRFESAPLGANAEKDSEYFDEKDEEDCWLGGDWSGISLP